MSSVRVTKKVRESYERLLKNKGELGLYCSIVGEGFNARIHTKNPELNVLNRAEAFFSMYRRTGNNDYFTIGRVLRRAAHRLYRQFNKMDTERPVNKRFLHIVKRS